MKNFKYVLMALSILLFSNLGFSHAGHEHGHEPISDSKAIIKAKEVILKMVTKNKLDPSWKQVEKYAAHMQKDTKGDEWRVTIENKASTGEKTLYIFLSPQGDYKAANFTGK